MYITIVLLPLLSAIVAGFFGRFIGSKGAQFITTSSVGLAFILSCIAFYEVALSGSPCYVTLFPWMDSEMFYISWGFMFDTLTVIMLVVVTSISFLVHMYSIEYMETDPHIPRFMSYLSIFTFFMLILVTADNFVQLFVGWEGVGLASYLLINFWFTRLQANKSAMKAFIVNRIGDFGFSLGMFTTFMVFKSLDFATVFALAPNFYNYTISVFNMELDALTVIGLLFFVGAVGKSAQIGLHTWLPDAMEGPTPVSALIHAATMVTAGVFLIIRCSPLFEYAPFSLIVITFIGSITAFFAASIGLVQNDLKRVIAYSTCSQLGYMIFACGLSNYSVSMFHLFNHAFFKALLFLSAGAVIHAMNDEQDMRKMGGLINVLPITYSMIVIGSLSLMGFPFLTGFYSKDVILEIAFAKFTVEGTFAHWLGTISAFFTSFYSFRLIYLTFLNTPQSNYNTFVKAHEPVFYMLIPLFILGFGSIFIGYITKDMFIGLGTNFWGNAIFISQNSYNMIDAEFIPVNIKLLPVILSICGASLAIILYTLYSKLLLAVKLNPIGKMTYGFLSKKWYFDKIYNEFVVQKLFDIGYNVTFKILDRGLIEVIGPYGIANTISSFVQRFTRLQSGYVYHYAFIICISLTFLIFYYGLWFMIQDLFDIKLFFIFLISLLFISTKY